VAGSCLFIYYGNERNNFDKIYKNKFLLHIGLISYSLYLWHQPILAYFKNLFNNNIPSLYYYLIYFLIYIFSVASFYLIEKSFYEKQILRNKKFTLFIFLSTLIIIFTGFLIASGKVNIENSINKQVSDIQKKFPNLDIKDIAQKRGFQNHDFFNKKFSNTGKIKIYISGDSHSKDLFLILQSSEKITKFYEFSLDNIDEADAILYNRQFYEEMLKDFEKHDIFIKTKGKNKKIIIIGRAAEFYTGNIDPLIFNLIQDPNNLNAYKNNNKEFIDKNFYNILRDDVIKINKQLKIKAEEMGALYIDRVDLGCDIIKQACHSMTADGYPIYWDHSHLTWQGVNFFSNLVDKKNWFGPVEEFLKKNK
jgi:hypothetical protein